MRRLSLYAPEMQELHQLGVSVLVPLQVGLLTHTEFYRAAVESSGFPLVPAFTMKKAATSDKAAAEFLHEIKPARVHLLGMGLKNRKAGDFLGLIRAASSVTAISMDRNRLRTVIGKSRSMTILEHQLKEDEVRGVTGEVESRVLESVSIGLDYTDCGAFPSMWASTDSLRIMAVASSLSLVEAHKLINNPDDFLQELMPGLDLT